jgi:predicted nucleic acid-binding protein
VILVDTDAWVHHLRTKDKGLVELSRQEHIRTCDVVIGELLLGPDFPPA